MVFKVDKKVEKFISMILFAYECTFHAFSLITNNSFSINHFIALSNKFLFVQYLKIEN